MKGVVKRLRAFFAKYPESKPSSACYACGLDPRKYGATARVIKSRTMKHHAVNLWLLKRGFEVS